MKTLLIPILAGALLPLSTLEAKTYGGFKAGKTFKLTVTDRESVRTKNGDVDRGVPIPKDLPNFKVGQTVKFKIGKQGALRGPGFKIDFEESSKKTNVYSNEPDNSSASKGDAAVVRKNDSKQPTKATVTFYKYKISGFKLVTNSVTYKFGK